MQYLNIMTELEINGLAKMLCSENTEICKIAVNILINKYDLDFDIWESYDCNTDLWVYNFHQRSEHSQKFNTLVFLNMLSLKISCMRKYYDGKSIIKLIIEYNERKQNK